MDSESLFQSLLSAGAAQGLTFDDPQPPVDRFVEVDGLRLHYLDWGVEGNTPMVLVHGRAVTAHSWDFYSLMMRPYFHVRALDQRGHGDSEWDPEGDYSRERHADDLVAFIDHLGAEKLVLVGHSLGGAVALMATPRLTERLAAIVVVDSTLKPRQAPSDVERFVQSQDVFPSLDALAKHANRFNPRRDYRQLLGSLRHNTKELPDGTWTWKYDSKLRDPNHRIPAPTFETVWQSLRNPPCPILVVRASERSHIGDDVAAELEALGPTVQVVQVPNSGHSVMGDNPRGFAEATSQFLRSAGLMPGARGSDSRTP